MGILFAQILLMPGLAIGLYISLHSLSRLGSFWIRVISGGVLAFALVIPYLFETDRGEEEDDDGGGQKNTFILKTLGFIGRYSTYLIIIALLLGLVGWMFIQLDALEKRRARENAFENRSEFLRSVYELDNGENIPADIYSYSKENDIAPVVPPYDGSFPSWAQGIDIDPMDEITIRATLAGEAWRANCGDNTPMARFTTHTPNGGRHPWVNYIAFFDEQGKLRINLEKQGGGKLDFNVGCPTENGWIQLDYEVSSFFLNHKKKI